MKKYNNCFKKLMIGQKIKITMTFVFVFVVAVCVLVVTKMYIAR